MEWRSTRLLVMAVALSLLTVGLAFSAGAQDKKEDNDGQVTYVNTDNGIVWCLPGATPDEVSVHEPVDGSVLVGAGPGLSEDIEDPVHGNNVCLGGAVFTLKGDNELEGGDVWKLWAQEQLEHERGGVSCDPGDTDNQNKLLCPSGFAQIRSTYTFETTPVPDGPDCQLGTWTDVCTGDPTQPSETTDIAWVTHKTVVCNDLQIELDGDVLGHGNAEAEIGTPLGDHVSTTHTILLFFSGTDFVLDCFNDDFGVFDAYEGLVHAINSVTCSNQPGDPGEGLPNILCITPQQFGGTACSDRVGTLATVGTASYEIADEGNDHFCDETFDHDDPVVFPNQQPLVTVENIPVQIDS